MTPATDRRGEGVCFTFEDDLVTAIGVESGVAGCGPTKADALEEIADNLRLHARGEPGIETAAADRETVRELGIDPEDVEPTNDLPEFLV